MHKVKTGRWYTFQPVGMDLYDSCASVAPGSRVQVKRLPGCPPPNTIGHCHIVDAAGRFAGLVLTNSLQPITRGAAHG
jgi:hypothetical protein